MILNATAVQAKKPEGYSNIDIAKFVCSLFVIVIHTSPLSGVSNIVQFYVEDVITRVAVPLFYAFTGFFFFGKLVFEKGKIVPSTGNLRNLFQYCKKTAVLYLSWSLAYIVIILMPMWYQTGYWGPFIFKDCLATLLFKGSYYHLWYLLSLIYAIPLLYGLLCCLDYKKISVFVFILWICECLTYSYSWVGVDRIPFVSFISDRMPVVFDSLFRAIPLLAVGAFVSQYQPIRQPQKACCAALLAIFVYAVEVSVLFFFSPNIENFSYLFSTLFFAFTWLVFLISTKQCNISPHTQLLFRRMSLIIYCIHPMVLDVLHVFGVSNGFTLWITVTLLSIGLAAGWAVLKQGTQRKRPF